MSAALVDWGLAGRIAVSVAGGDDSGGNGRAHPAILRPEGLEPVCAEALDLVRRYSRLEPTGPIPGPEAVGRAEWSKGVLETMRELATELERRGTFDVSLPGPFGRIGRSVLGVGLATEVGVAAGYAARRVLGQYDLSLLGPERPARLLFVAPNLTGAAAAMEIDAGEFVRWVALHETTHAVQFASAPWLREHLGALIRRLLGGAASELSLGQLVRRLVRDPREAVSAFARGDAAKALLGKSQAPLLERIQATMTVIEGHAEHVMDGAAEDFVADVAGLREKLEARRRQRGPLETILSRILGLDLKLRQYELGKRFCDEVTAEGGIEALNRIWDGPGAMPSEAELRDPGSWLERIRTGATPEHPPTAL